MGIVRDVKLCVRIDCKAYKQKMQK